jgi:5'-nucleotidase
MRVLVTNDDGIGAPGIAVLARGLRDLGHDVVVVAPDRDMSGMSAALRPVEVGLDINRVDLRRSDIDGIEGWAVPGPPALGVFAAAHGSFGGRPDCVVSGINDGLNTGRSLLHSGTVGAALTAATFSVPAMAVSIETGHRPRWETAWEFTARGLAWLTAHPVAGTVLNLNVPDRPLADVQGFRWATLDRYGAVQAVGDDPADGLTFELRSADRRAVTGSDLALIEDGFATASLIRSVTAVDATEAELAPLEEPGEITVVPRPRPR